MSVTENNDNIGVVGYYIGKGNQVSVQETTQDCCQGCGADDEIHDCLVAVVSSSGNVVLCRTCWTEAISAVPRVFEQFVNPTEGQVRRQFENQRVSLAVLSYAGQA